MFQLPRFMGVISCLLLVVLLGVVGCGERTGSVTGEVKWQGAPVKSAAINFIGQEGKKRVGSGTIQNGKYTVQAAPVGKVVITIQPFIEPPPPEDKDPKTGKPKKPKPTKAKKDEIPPIPLKYAGAKTSPLEYTVTTGEQEYNITIEP